MIGQLVKNCYNVFNATNNYLMKGIIIRSYAARKGTREKRMKIQRKRKAERLEREKREKAKQEAIEKQRVVIDEPLRFDDSNLPVAVDNVFFKTSFQEPIYSLSEAVQCLSDIADPTMYNLQGSNLLARVELNLGTAKKKRLVDAWHDIVEVSYPFASTNKRILFLSGKKDILEKAIDHGASLTGGIDIIKQLQKGGMSPADFDQVLATPDMLQDLVTIRGILKKKKFPTSVSGTLGVDVDKMMSRFLRGVEYRVKIHLKAVDYGWSEIPFGNVMMPTKELESNLSSILSNVLSHKLSKEKFISRIYLKLPDSCTRLKIDEVLYTGEHIEVDDDTDDDD